jgi:hypothetical protein
MRKNRMSKKEKTDPGKYCTYFNEEWDLRG